MSTIQLDPRVTESPVEAESGYKVDSAFGTPHFVDYIEEQHAWMVWPSNTASDGDGYITVAQAREYVRELQAAIRSADKLNASRPRPVAPCDAAITTEIEALIGDREWDEKYAAGLFGITQQKLTSRLRGHTSWPITDLSIISDALTAALDEANQMFWRLIKLSFDAYEGVSQ